MHIHYEELTDVARYIENHAHIDLDSQKPTIENILENIKRFTRVDEHARILEIGVGSGWLQTHFKREGLNVRGLEISPQLIEVAREIGRRYGADLDLELGNIEETEIGVSQYDVVIASSVFEHVEDWRKGVKKIYDALRPGGLLYFDSTNKFSFVSGEYNFPLYGWMPDSWRYRLRRARQGDDIMKLGIDFHQFTYPQLRRYFKQVGFATVMDLVDFKDASRIRSDSSWKRLVLRSVQRAKPLKHVALTFAPATIFICVK